MEWWLFAFRLRHSLLTIDDQESYRSWLKLLFVSAKRDLLLLGWDFFLDELFSLSHACEELQSLEARIYEFS